MFEKIKNNRFVLALSIVVFVLALGAALVLSGITDAYFTDNDGDSTIGKTGKVGIAITNIDTLFAETADTVQSMNGGSYNHFNFDVENTGNIAMDITTSIIITSPSNVNWEEFSKSFLIYDLADVDISSGSYVLKDGAVPIGEREVTDEGIIITLPKGTIAGKNDGNDDVKSYDLVFYFGDVESTVDLIFTTKANGVKAGNRFGWKDSDEFIRYGRVGFNPYRNILETGVDFNAHLMELAGVNTSAVSLYDHDIPVLRDLLGNEIAKYEIRFTNLAVPADVTTVDVSMSKDRSILAWVDNVNKVVYVVATDGGIIKANEDCAYMFTNWRGLVTFDSFNSINTVDMSYMFYGYNYDSVDLSEVETENVGTMAHMFDSAQIPFITFGDEFNTTNVTDMSYMFNSFAGSTAGVDLSVFDTSNVETMEGMFQKAKLSGDFTMSDWETSKVKTMAHMFDNCSISWATDDYLAWDVSAVIDMSYMFRNASFMDGDVVFDSWNVANVKYMQYMFADNKRNYTLDISTWNSNSVVDMSHMFAGCYAYDSRNNHYDGLQSINFGAFKTDACKDMSYMFYDSSALRTLDLSGFNTANVEDMSFMFAKTTHITVLNPKPEGVTTIDLSSFDTSNVLNMQYMFANTSALTALDVSGFNTSKVQDMQYMFYSMNYVNAGKYYGPKAIDVSGFDTSNVKNMQYMFYGFYRATTLNVSNWNTEKVEDMQYMFYNCSSLTSLGVGNWNTECVGNMQHMFDECRALTTLDVSGWKTGNVQDMQYMFDYCVKLQSLALDGWDTSKVNNFASMFEGCKVLSTIGNVNSWNTATVTDMSRMFYDCQYLKSLDLGGWNTSNVKSISRMFYQCKNLTTLNVSGWDVSTLNDFSYLFYYCQKLTTIDLTGWQTTAATDMSYMFYWCSQLTNLDISGFDVSNVTNTSYMLYNVVKIKEFDLSTWEFKNPFKADYMFGSYGSYDSQLRTIYANNWTNLITSTGVVFESQQYLVGDTAAFSSNYLTKAMANPETGYFSTKPVLETNMLIPGYHLVDFLPSSVTSVIFTDKVASGVSTTDLSALGDGSVVGWLSGSTYYVASTNGDKIVAHPKMNGAFEYKRSLVSVDFSNLDSSYVTDVTNMFSGNWQLKSYLWPGFDMKNVVSTASMFRSCQALTSIDTSDWDLSNVVTAQYMFYDCKALVNLDASDWDLSKCRDINNMFYGCTSMVELDLSDWKLDSLEYAQSTFNNMTNLVKLDLENWVLPNSVKDVSRMFYGCTKLCHIYAGDWTTGHTGVTSTYMFYNIGKTYGSGSGTISQANPTTGYFTAKTGTPNIMVMGYAFASYVPANTKSVVFDSNLTVPSGVQLYDLSLENDGSIIGWLNGTTFYVTKTVEGAWYMNADSAYMFNTGNAKNVVSVDFGDIDGGLMTTMQAMFKNCSYLESVKMANLNTANVTNMQELFYNCQRLTSLDLSGWNTSKVTNTYYAFGSCTNLKSLNLSGWNMAKNTNPSYMFAYCSNLGTIYAGDWTAMANPYNSTAMFQNCDNLFGAIAYNSSKTVWAYANPTTGYFSYPPTLTTNMLMEGPLLNSIIPAGATSVVFTDTIPANSITTDISALGDGSVVGWEGTGAVYYIATVDGSKVIAHPNCYNMFYNKTYLQSIDFTNLDTAQVVNMNSMFYGCTKLATVNTEVLDVSNLKTASRMFYNCSALQTIDLSTWNPVSLTNPYYMFRNCTSLTTIYAGDWTSIVTPATTNNVFYNCEKLVGATKFNSSNTGWNMASTTTGYFTAKN